MTHLWTIDAMADAMGATLEGAIGNQVDGVSIDTRTLEAGDAYFAVKGDVHDGHKFVAHAHAAGAAVCVVAHNMRETLSGELGTLLIVDDVLVALEKLGQAARQRTSAKIVAVTGSVGKTTTKEALRTALGASGRVHASAASYNNHWGVPLTLARMHENTQYGVFEIGMNHPGEITPLVKMVSPDVVVINNVAAVHLGAFKDVDEIAHAKAEIFDGLKAGGTAVLNRDDERFELLSDIAASKNVSNIVGFGESADADIHLEKLILHNSCSCLTARVLGTDMVVKLGVPGKHIAMNSLAVLAVCKLLGSDLAKAGLALAGMQAVKGRGVRHRLALDDDDFILIDESYNANPTSMRAAIALLAAAKTKGRGRHIAVLGDMLELGPTSSTLHRELAEPLKANEIDRAYLVGPEMKALQEELGSSIETTHGDAIDSLIPLIKQDLRGGDVLMAKASLGIGFAKLIDALTSDYKTIS